MGEALEAFSVNCTIVLYGKKTYMYQTVPGTWFIYIEGIGWAFPTEEEVLDIEALDYLMFNSGEDLH